MRVQHFYYDGCNGQQIGEHINDSVEECTNFLLNLDSESGQYDPDDPDNGWTPQSAKEALLEAILIKQPVYVDYDGDRQSWLVITED